MCSNISKQHQLTNILNLQPSSHCESHQNTNRILIEAPNSDSYFVDFCNDFLMQFKCWYLLAWQQHYIGKLIKLKTWSRQENHDSYFLPCAWQQQDIGKLIQIWIWPWRHFGFARCWLFYSVVLSNANLICLT